jgi:hypothetical protein
MSDGSETPKPTARPVVVRHATLFKGLIPLIFGLIAFLWLIIKAGKGEPDITHSQLMHSTAFLGIAIVYCIFVASVVVAIAGTVLYIIDLDLLSDLLHDIPGRAYVQAAKALTLFTIVIYSAAIIYFVAFQKNTISEESCSYSELPSDFLQHISFVALLFFLFISIDALTVAGTKMGLADIRKAHAGNDVKIKKLQLNLDFASQQIAFIDLPVIIGIVFGALIWSTAKLNPELMQFDSNLLTLSNVQCNAHLMTILSFNTMVSNIFLGGIATGFIAAHILMSQLVFFFLGWVHRLKEAEV